MNWPPPRPGVIQPARVAVAGQKLHFIEPILDRLRQAGADVQIDPWTGQTGHDDARSRELLAWADVVIAEWCLGNAVWYAQRKRRGQRLLVHFHRYEINTPQPERLDFDNVDVAVFVGGHFRSLAVARFGWDPTRSVVVPNAVDTERFSVQKRPEAEWTLGLLQYHRQLKRMDLALDVLEACRMADPRFRLSLKGPDPRAVVAGSMDPLERQWFDRIFDRIATSPALHEAVEFVPESPDVENWFDGIGYILSVSDVESFHLAIAEGMASAAVPVIRRREGTEELWAARWVHEDAATMAASVVAMSRAGDRRSEGRRARTWVDEHYGIDLVTAAWESLAWNADPQAPSAHRAPHRPSRPGGAS